jgi:3-dehydroquinate synthase
MTAILDITTEAAVPTPTCRTIVAPGALARLPEFLPKLRPGGRVFVISDSNVAFRYSTSVYSALIDADIRSELIVFLAGEEHKSLDTAESCWRELSRHKAQRGDVIVALGGGVVGDLAGFVASTYLRGIRVVQVPTTLLAMVDSAIGGKTGIDLDGKNDVGSFYLPDVVLIDPEVLGTLAPRVFTEGLAEVIKYGLLDEDLLDMLEERIDELDTTEAGLAALTDIIAWCARYKSEVIERDPQETQPDGRVLLNLGHTLAHGLETATGYSQLLHGEAVAIGMVFALQLSAELGVLEDDRLMGRLVRLLRAVRLPEAYTGQVDAKAVLEAMSRDKKNDQADTTRFVLPRSAGSMKVQRVDNKLVARQVRYFLNPRSSD